MGKEVDTNDQSSGSQSGSGGGQSERDQNDGAQGGHQAHEPAGLGPSGQTVAQPSPEKPERKRNLVQAKIKIVNGKPTNSKIPKTSTVPQTCSQAIGSSNLNCNEPEVIEIDSGSDGELNPSNQVGLCVF